MNCQQGIIATSDQWNKWKKIVVNFNDGEHLNKWISARRGHSEIPVIAIRV